MAAILSRPLCVDLKQSKGADIRQYQSEERITV